VLARAREFRTVRREVKRLCNRSSVSAFVQSLGAHGQLTLVKPVVPSSGSAEYGLVVEGAEFDQYDQKKANNTRPWTWQIGTSRQGDESDGEEPFDDEEPGTARGGGKGRAKAAPQKSKGRGKSKVGSDDEEEWTGDSDEEAEEVEEVEKGLRGLRKAPAVATRSHDRPRSRTRVDSDGSSDERGAGEVKQAGGKGKTGGKGGSNEGKAEVSKPGARASAAKGAGAKTADSKKRGARKKAQGNDSENESEDDDEPTAEDLDFIVDDEEVEAEEEESEDSGEEEWEVRPDSILDSCGAGSWQAAKVCRSVSVLTLFSSGPQHLRCSGRYYDCVLVLKREWRSTTRTERYFTVPLCGSPLLQTVSPLAHSLVLRPWSLLMEEVVCPRTKAFDWLNSSNSTNQV
jgi:hypothetical protein